MTTHAPPTTLAEFLLARCDEDEAVALAASAALTDWDSWPAVASDAIGMRKYEVGAHIARHDPARVLAEVAALRAVVELHGGSECNVCIWKPAMGIAPCATLRALAQPYADHPEFDPGWRA